MGVYKQNQTNANREETNSHQSSLPLLNHLLGKNQKNFPAVMDPGDTTPVIIIIKKIETLEPENASKIIEYFLLQEMKQIDLLRYAFGPDSLIQEFCRKAKAELSDWGHLLSKGFSSNPSARPFNTNDQLLSQSCGRNQFLDFSRNSNTSLSPSLIRDNPNSNSSLFHDGSSQFPFANEEFLGNNNPFPNLQTRSFSANDAFLESEQQRMIEARGFPMSNIQGSGQFGVEEGGFSPGSQERKYLNSKQLFFTFRPKSSFTDEDVSTYFSKFGSVVDVTIPYQKRRTFGFVTFANAETVRTLLDRDNLHFICGSRVRVKPYKEKENILQNPGTDEREDINSRKIYLTFQPYSSFTDEDVSTYFSKFGPVVDVYIPYQDQQRRMFGFVTFANAETVKTILDQGNPHCICKSPVKAKPYIEKAKILQNSN